MASERTRRRRADRRASRLRYRFQFDRVFGEGGKEVGRRVVLRYLCPAPDGQTRLSLPISRRYSLRAVDRNRARRVLKAAWRDVGPVPAPCWIVLLPRRRLRSCPFPDVKEELRTLRARAGLLAETGADSQRAPDSADARP